MQRNANRKPRSFTFAIEFAGGVETTRSMVAVTEKQAQYDLWEAMTDEERDALVCTDCIDEQEVA